VAPNSTAHVCGSVWAEWPSVDNDDEGSQGCCSPVSWGRGRYSRTRSISRATRWAGRGHVREERTVPPKLADRCISGEGNLDGILCARLVDENHLSYKLQDQVLSNFNVDAWKDPTEGFFKKGDEFEMTKVPADLAGTGASAMRGPGELMAKKFAPQVPVKLRTFTHQMRWRSTGSSCRSDRGYE